ncbi:glycosyl transferase [Chitinispirillum alkaliphilum]|nr:glycosyl transferase [Chitinispirillum alkaliphilum]
MVHEKSIAIVIASYLRPQRARSVVNQLTKLITPADSIIVVWQKKNYDHLLQKHPSLKTTTLKHANLPAARNTGIINSSSDIVLFLDDDVEIDNLLLEKHRCAYETPDTGGIAGFVQDPIFPISASAPSYFDITTGECVQNFSLPEKQLTISMMGANMSFKRSAIEMIQGFDTNYKGNALWEEIDAAFRLRNAGFRIMYCPEAKVKHLRENQGGCRSSGKRIYLYHQFANTAYFACRYMPLKHCFSWLKFWKNRLEFLTRKEQCGHYKTHIFSGICGAIAGILRYSSVSFVLKSKRINSEKIFPSQ